MQIYANIYGQVRSDRPETWMLMRLDVLECFFNGWSLEQWPHLTQGLYTAISTQRHAVKLRTSRHQLKHCYFSFH